jgi:hypothetical protein
MRLMPFPQRFSEYCRMEHVTPNTLSWGNVKNEMNNFTIAESLSSRIVLSFISTSYSNTMILQSQATMVKLKPLKLLPKNLSGLEYVKT